MKHLDTEALQNEALRILHQVHPKNMTYDQWLGAAGAAYKHALVERDTGSLEHQVETIHQLRLPVTATIYSGDKSAHAAARVDTADQKQYCERVAFLHDYCNAAQPRD